jgi:23S rRNA pseudouridine955/2504/2580 synthase
MSESSEKTPKARHLVVSDRAGQRLDNFLLAEIQGVPRSLIYRIVRTGEVRVNKGRAKAGYRVQAGDRIRIPPLRLADPRPPTAFPSRQLERLAAAVIYEDDRLLVVNKPSGLAVHGGSGVIFGVIEGLRALYPDQTGLELVHRLDRDTSGCLLVAKRRSMLRWLHQQIREQRMEKRYLALLAGDWRDKQREVDAPLRKNTLQSGERVVRVDPTGRPSRTGFRRLRGFQGATLVEARLHTGRTHQIRVHAAHLGTPVLGDEKYGDRAANATLRALGLKRLFLHAAALTFDLPGEGGRFEIQAPLTDELKKIIEKLSVSK